MSTYSIYIDAAKRALERAYEGECHKHFAVIESDDTSAEGVYIKGETLYFVTLVGCSCKGSDNGRTRNLCRHQLCLADLTGKLDAFIPNAYSVGERAAALAVAA